MHVFGPPDRYPGVPDRTYAPSPKPLAEYRRISERLGLARVVLVQPSAYGTDNRALLDTLGQGAPTMRAVAVIDGSFGADTLRSMHHAGVRGIRLNLMSPRITETAAARALLQGAADQVAPLGWHVQIYGDGDILAVVAPLLPDLPVPVVFDHMGGARARLGLQEPGFRLLCTLLAREHCWAKLSGADIVAEDDHQLDKAVDFARALVAANPARLVWGTDWPHLVHQHAGIGDAAPPAGYRPVDETALLDVLRASLDGAPAWRAILVDNPARLYGF
ncbi:MAG TPA: amidohydrolase family protein [Acetobacteraceae bacterium]|nr:amidohydrolase family protein [Acetobacteraceae bacterium]